MSNNVTAKAIKEQAKKLGADLTGICSADVMNRNPPDPRWPQTPERLWPGCRSIVVLAKRIPLGMLHAEDKLARQYTPQLVMHALDSIALELSYFIEDYGCHAFPTPQQHNDTSLKKGTYGPLSLRHAAVEAGLGTLGLNLNLITPEYGPRVYLTAVLTDAELEPDKRHTERLCPGATCGRCLMACPVDAIEHWGLNKRLCSTQAQPYGVSTLMTYFDRMITAPTQEERQKLAKSPEVVDLWQALRSGASAYAACPHCLEVCPLGKDYKNHLKQRHSSIPKNEDKAARLEAMRQAERKGENIPNLERSARWVGNQPGKTN